MKSRKNKVENRRGVSTTCHNRTLVARIFTKNKNEGHVACNFPCNATLHSTVLVKEYEKELASTYLRYDRPKYCIRLKQPDFLWSAVH